METNKMTIEIYFDGSCHNQKGQSSNMGIGVAVVINQGYREDLSKAVGVTVEEAEKDGDRGTSNIAEWRACTLGMEVAAELKRTYPHAHINVFGDSQIITSQFNGEFRINNDEFRKYLRESMKYANIAKVRKAQWIPRHKNTLADKHSKEGLQMAKERQVLVV